MPVTSRQSPITDHRSLITDHRTPATCHLSPVTCHLPLATLLVLGAVLLMGCQSAREPGSLGLASVQVQGHPLAEIQQTATAVFRDDGYATTSATSTDMVFERPGSRRDAAKWGGWSGQGVTLRVKLALSALVDGGYLLEASAQAVQNSDDPFFRTESRNLLLNRRPCQKLLDEIARRLKQP